MSRLNNFLNDIHKEYVNARYAYKSTTKRIMRGRSRSISSKRIMRGRSRSISSISEDLFARLLCREIKNKNIRIFVDQGVFLVGKKQTYYPDIIICKEINQNEYEIFFMIDLKMDTGFCRKSIYKIPGRHKMECKKMKSVVELRSKRGDTENEKKIDIKFTINKKASYDVVIISSTKQSNKENKLLQLSRNNKESLWVLSTGRHPNWYKDKKDKKVEANEKDWKRLITRIKQIIK